ncbi:hypothetical protein [Sciscionella marina]|uniref:hypothetical protein n=1 Tax=Sciscionella marina TaxID=508770 RepID=UPI0003643340|nr:hypothetical protein [Sciscionella marina]
MREPRSWSAAELALWFLQREGQWQAVLFRVMRGEIPERLLRQYAAEFREAADELEQAAGEVITPAEQPTKTSERAQVRPEVIDALNAIHVVSDRSGTTLLENTRSPQDLHALLLRAAHSLMGAANLAIANARAIEQATENLGRDGGEEDG